MLIEQYARFIRENHLRDLSNLQIDIISKMDVPIMKLFTHLTREELVESGLTALSDQLLAFEEDRALEHLLIGLRQWEQDKLEGGISRTVLQPADLVFIYAAQRQGLTQLIPQFTDESKQAIQLSIEISSFYTEAENEAFKVLFKIKKETEDALRESEERFRSITESATDSIMVTDHKFNILYCNSATEDILQYSEDELSKINLRDLILGDGETLQKTINEINNKQTAISNYLELSLIAKDDTKIPADISVSRWHSENKDYFGFIIHNISQRKAFEDELRKKADELDRSNNALQQFAYVASHDMREPLRMITSFLQLLERKHKDSLPEEALNYVGLALDGAQRLSALINDLLNYSRVNSGKPNLKETDFNNILTEVKLNLTEALKDKNVDLEFKNMPQKLVVDPIKLTQLFQNLIANAIKFNEKQNPKVTITGKENSQNWQFTVQDNGIGMTQDQLNQAFVMFRRLHGKEYPGTGIGLALCKRIVEQHNGNIWVQSEPDKGTTFFFTIPKKIVLEPLLMKH